MREPAMPSQKRDDSSQQAAMNRTALAFAIAPLWTPCLLTLGAWSVGGGSSSAVMVWFIGLLFSYSGTYLLGLPAFFILRSRGVTSVWIAAFLGFAIGNLAFQVFYFLFGLALGNTVTMGTVAVHLQKTFTQWSAESLIAVAVPGFFGILVGITIWAIARPDRA